MQILRRRHKTTVRKTRRPPGSRGHTGPGGGAWPYMQNPQFFRGTANEVAGLYPWMIGSGTPTIGVPIGRVKRKQSKGSVVFCDPVSWFERAHLISQPSAFILGLPALGKSTLIKHWILGLDFFGIKSLVLGDLKGEYVELIKALGGQVIEVGRGRGYLNVLDMGDAPEAAKRLRAAGKTDAALHLMAAARGRRQIAVETLLTIHRAAAVNSVESGVISEALRILDARRLRRTPILMDLLDIIKTPTDSLHKMAVSRDNLDSYQEITRQLEADLEQLTAGHGLGEIFSKATTTQLVRRQHAVYDVSSIGDGEQKLQAAALMLCWEIGFGSIAVSNALADAGLETQQPVHAVLDELWRVLRAGPGLVDRADGLTRLNRDKGVAVTYASHTMEDLKALPTPEDISKAEGLLERCGMVIAFGLPASEMPRLSKAVRLSSMEKKTLNGWTTPKTWTTRKKTRDKPPPGRGKCLIKVGERRGIAVEIELLEMEKQFNKTSKRWAA
jgi:hypothetical protein